MKGQVQRTEDEVRNFFSLCIAPTFKNRARCRNVTFWGQLFHPPLTFPRVGQLTHLFPWSLPLLGRPTHHVISHPFLTITKLSHHVTLLGRPIRYVIPHPFLMITKLSHHVTRLRRAYYLPFYYSLVLTSGQAPGTRPRTLPTIIFPDSL